MRIKLSVWSLPFKLCKPYLDLQDAGVGRFVLEKMGRASGESLVSHAESESELAGICTQIVLEPRRQYTFGFYVNATGRRKSHTLKLQLRDAGTRRLMLSYPESYFY